MSSFITIGEGVSELQDPPNAISRDFSEMTQFHAHYVNETLFSKATISASVTHVAVLLVIGSNLGLISDRFRDTAICTVKLSIKIAAKPLQMKTWLILTAYKKLTAPYPMVRSQILYGLPFSHNTARLTYCSAL